MAASIALIKSGRLFIRIVLLSSCLHCIPDFILYFFILIKLNEFFYSSSLYHILAKGKKIKMYNVRMMSKIFLTKNDRRSTPRGISNISLQQS